VTLGIGETGPKGISISGTRGGNGKADVLWEGTVMQSGDRFQIAKHAFPQQPPPVLCFPRGEKVTNFTCLYEFIFP